MMCSIGWHKWGKWTGCALICRGLLVKTPYEVIGQIRKCEKCGLEELKS